MAITAPVHADVLPVAPSIDRPDDFDPEADAFAAAQGPFGIQMNALGDNVYANALAVQALASAADNNAQNAATSAAQAALSKNAAVQAAQDAAGFTQAAADSAAASAASSTSLTANSPTALVHGNGSKVFTIPAGKQFPPGELVQVGSTGTPAARMFGTVASYVGTTLTVTVTKTQGPAGTYSDWVITPAGADGPAGGTAGGQLTGALDELKATSPASSATPDIWGAGGNYVPITQTAAITGFPPAPQPGARRNLFCVNGFPLVSGANLTVRGGTRDIAPGDEVEIVADTTTTFKATIKRGNGFPVSPQVFTHAEMYTSSATFVTKIAGPHRYIVLGAGGSGACNWLTSGIDVSASATGGAAGGMAIKDSDGVAGVSYSFIAGTPGAANTSGARQDGSDGTVTTFTGPGVAITCNGGKGGRYSITGAALAGSVGGTATGGDFNYKGGDSGSCGTAPAGSLVYQATGGGAVAWNSVSYSSGDVSFTSSATSGYIASGGASTGGRSGNVTLAASGNAASGGAGAAGASPSVTTATTGSKGPGYAFINITPLNVVGGANNSGPAIPGSASDGVLAGGVLTLSGPLAGTGATASSNLQNGVTGASYAGLGAGSGGVSFSTRVSGGVANGGLPALIALY